MKIAVYAIAVLAAVGIMFTLINSPTQSDSSQPASAVSQPAMLVSAEPMSEAGEMTLEVPGMHCQFACYPRVEKSLKDSESVAGVELAAQPDPNALTVKRVIIRYNEGFTPKTVLEKLEQDGYEATIVQ